MISFAGDVDLRDSSVLVTGGTGSFGKRLVRTLLERHGPRRIVVFSRDEQKHFDMQQMAPFRDRPELRYFIGDVRQRDRLELAMDGVDYVVHAAAMKHVHLAEYNPFECIHTNVLGAENVVRAAINHRVKKVIALSTDKACSPVNLYGASKLASDKIFIAANSMAGSRLTRFAVVRYGNVVGSRGSVIPFFKKLLAEGSDSLPVTDERMTRFWITLNQGVDFLLSCFGTMEGGEVFIPKIPSMRITDLVQAMAPHLPIRVVGIRPGEKLHEDLINVSDAPNTFDLGDRYVIEPNVVFFVRSSLADTGAARVDDGFAYASNTNAHWLSHAELGAMIDETEDEA